jgi:hypothetical protein
LAGCDRFRADPLPPPRAFMPGGVWFPAATGYWLHQYAEADEIERLMHGLGFACEPSTGAGRTMRCERGFRFAGGMLSRKDYVQLTFRRNGAVAAAQSGCEYAVFDWGAFSGTCNTYAARGAVYPNVQAFATMTEAMLRPAPMHQPISMFRLPPGVVAPLADAQAAVDLLSRWRYDCEQPRRQYAIGFRGRKGEILMARCRQWSLRTSAGEPQSQEIVVRYDSVDLAVLEVSVRLDDAAATLSPALNTRIDASARAKEPPALTLETLAGEKFEMPMSAVGSGSREQTREGFATLTPQSQRVLVEAYLDKQSKDWPGKLTHRSHANLPLLEWYGPQVQSHLDALIADDPPELGAALVKYMCFDSPLRDIPSGDADRLAQAMAACIDQRRADLPNTIALMDRLLAADLRGLANMNARALDAFWNFRLEVLEVYALGADAKEAGTALDEVAGGKEGLDPNLARLVQSALVQRDRPAISR